MKNKHIVHSKGYFPLLFYTKNNIKYLDKIQLYQVVTESSRSSITLLTKLKATLCFDSY